MSTVLYIKDVGCAVDISPIRASHYEVSPLLFQNWWSCISERKYINLSLGEYMPLGEIARVYGNGGLQHPVGDPVGILREVNFLLQIIVSVGT